MSPEAIIILVFSALTTGAVGLWFAKIAKDGDKVDADLNRRLLVLEGETREHMKRDIIEHRDLDVRLSRAETTAESMKDSIEGIGEKIDALSQRIDDALRRSMSPPPRRR